MIILPFDFTGTKAELFEYKEFKALCYSLQSTGVYKINSISEFSYPDNFYCAYIRDFDEEFVLVFNIYSKIVGFKKSLDDQVFFDKIPASRLIRSFNKDIIIPESHDLNEGITNKHLSMLHKYEAKEVKSWDPQSVGEVLFCSCFD